jgi:hypothetical protein
MQEGKSSRDDWTAIPPPAKSEGRWSASRELIMQKTCLKQYYHPYPALTYNRA